MNEISVIPDALWPSTLSAAAPERRLAAREPASLLGRLAYGGLTPGLVGCDVLDISETGVRVETFAPLEHVPELVTVEICGVYNRARCSWVRGRQIGLEFVFDDADYIDGV
jgi:hypothetical protein